MKQQRINRLLIIISAAAIIASAALFLAGMNKRTQNSFHPDKAAQDLTQDTFSQQITDISALVDKSIPGFIYFGRDSCHDCVIFNEAINLIRSEMGDQFITIYKFDTDFWRESEEFEIVLDTYAVESVPAFFYVSESGDITSILSEEASVQEIYDRILAIIEGNV